MIPLKDDNPTRNRTFIRLIIIILCSLVFLFQISSDSNYLIQYYGFKPSSLFSFDYNLPTFIPSLTLITSMFLHGGWLHFLGNMIYLWIFGDNIEDSIGFKKFIVFYLSSGVFACLAQAFGNIDSDIPMIGASGAIAGVLGAYFYLFPRAKILVLIPIVIFFFTIRLPAFIVLGFWFILQFLNFSLLADGSSNVAWLAHIGGFIYGLLYASLFVKKNKRKRGKSIMPKKKNPWNKN